MVEWASAIDYAQAVGLPVKTIRRFCRRGVLPHFQVGRIYKVNVVEADKVLAEMATAKPVTYIGFQESLREFQREVKAKCGGNM